MRASRAVPSRKVQRGGPGLYDYTSSYLSGRTILDPFTGLLWTSTAPIPRYLPPPGLGNGSTLDRLLLLSQRYGPARTVTGGYSGATYVVTNTLNSGAGSFRAAIESSEPLWIVFDKTVYPPGSKTQPQFTSPLTVMPNKTIDGRGAGVSLPQGFLIQGIGNPNSSSTSFIRYPNGVANLIWTHVSIDVVSSNANRDAFTLSYGFDLTWFNHLDVLGGTDASIDMTAASNGGVNNLWSPSVPLGRVSITWCRFGPMPSAANMALFPATGGNNRPENGKTNLVGLDPEDSAYPNSLQVMFDHCLWDGCVQRNPKVQWSNVHLSNFHVKRWGLVPGVVASSAHQAYYSGIGKSSVVATHGSVGSDISHGGNMLIENGIYTPYVLDESHVLDASWPMHYPDPDAIYVDAATLGSTGGVRSSNVIVKGAATRDPDSATAKVLERDYAYAKLEPDLVLETELSIGTGNYQPWVLT